MAETPETPKKWLGWKRRSPSTSAIWGQQNLQPGPLVQHLIQLHGLALTAGMEGDMLAVFEHSLKEISRHTQMDPHGFRRQ